MARGAARDLGQDSNPLELKGNEHRLAKYCDEAGAPAKKTQHLGERQGVQNDRNSLTGLNHAGAPMMVRGSANSPTIKKSVRSAVKSAERMSGAWVC